MATLSVIVAMGGVVPTWCPWGATLNVEKLLDPDTPYCLTVGPPLSSVTPQRIYRNIYGPDICYRSYTFFNVSVVRFRAAPMLDRRG